MAAEDGLGARQSRQIIEQSVKEPLKVMDQLKGLLEDEGKHQVVSEVLQNLAHLNFDSMQQRLAVAEALLNHLDDWKKLSRGDAQAEQWADILASSLSASYYEEGLLYGSLLALGQDQDLPESDQGRQKVLKTQQRRLQLYQRLCEEMLAFSSQSAVFFSRLVLLAEAGGISDEELLLHCQRSLRLLTESNARSYFGKLEAPTKKLGEGVLKWESVATPSAASGPIPWLIEYAFRTGNESVLEQAKNLPSDKALGEALLMLGDYYFCSEKGFAQSVEKVESFSRQSGKYGALLSQKIQWIMMRRALALRPAMDKAFALEKFVEHRLQGEFDWITQQFSFDQIRLISMRKGDKEIYAFLKKATQAMGLDRAQLSKDKKEAPELVAFLNQVGSSLSCVYAAMIFAKAYGQADYIQIDMSRDMMDPIGHYAIVLELYRSPFFIEAEKYVVFPTAEFPKVLKDRRYDTIAGYRLHFLLNRLCGDNNASARKLLRETFGKLDTFGAKLMVALFEEQSHVAVLSFFAEQRALIEKLPQKKQRELALLAKDLICPPCLPKLRDEKSRATMSWIFKTAASGEFARIKKYAEAKTITEAGLEPETILELAGKDLQRALAFDWRAAYAAFENLAILGEAAVLRGEIDLAEQTFTERLLNECLFVARPVEAFVFMTKLLQSESLPTVFNYNSLFHSSLMHLSHRAKNADVRLKEFATFIRLADSEMDSPSDLAVTLPFFCNLLSIMDLEVRPPPYLVDWAKEPAVKQRHPQLVEQIQLAVELLSSKRNGPSPQGVKKFKEVLKSDDFSDSAACLLATLVSHLDERESEELLKFNLLLLEKLWEKNGADVGEDLILHTLRHLQAKRRRLTKEEYMEAGWSEAEKSLIQAYQQYVLTPKSKPKRFQIDEPDNFIKEDLIRMLLQNNGEGAVKKMLKQVERPVSEMSNSYQVFAHLIRAGSYSEATDILKGNWVQMLDAAAVLVTFDQRLADHVKPFLKALDGEPVWLKWLAEYLLIRTEEKNGEPPAKGWEKVEVRLSEVARRLPLDDFPDEVTSLRILLSFLDFPETESMHKDALLKVAQGISFQSINQELDQELQKLLVQAYLYQAIQEVLAGDTRRIDQLLVQVGQWQAVTKNKTDGNSSHYGKWLPAIQLLITNPRVLEKCREADFARKILPYFAQIGERRVFGIMDGDSNAYLSAVIFLHMVLDRAGEIQAFVAKLPKGSVEYFEELFRGAERSLILAEVFRLFYWPRYHVPNRLFDSDTKNRPKLKKMHPKALEMITKLKDLKESFVYTAPIDRKLTTFLKASTIAETGYSPQRFLAEVGRLMRGRQNLRERRQIYDKSIALIEKQLSGQGEWKQAYQNGGSLPGQVFHRLAFSQGDSGGGDLALLTDIWWHDTPAGFSLAEHSAMARYAAQLWKKVAISGQMLGEHTVSELLASLRSILPANSGSWGNVAVFRPVFFEVCQVIEDVGFLERVLKMDSMKDNPLYREFSLAIQMYLAAQNKAKGAVSQNSKEIGDDWVQAALFFLRDEPKAELRAYMIQHLFLRGFTVCPAVLQQRLWQETLRIVEEGGPVNGWYWTHMLNQFGEAPRNQKWQEQARNFINAWKILNKKQDHPWRDYQALTSPLLAQLRLLYQVGQTQVAEEFFRQNEAVFKNSGLCLALLIKHGSFEVAQGWLLLDRQSLILSAPETAQSAFQMYYDIKFEQQGDRFFKQVKSAEDRFIAKLCCYHLRDPSGFAGGEVESLAKSQRDQRMQSLVTSYSAELFGSERKHFEVLNALSEDWRSSKKVMLMLDKYFTVTRLEALLKQAGSYVRLRPKLKAMQAWILSKVKYQNDSSAVALYYNSCKNKLPASDQFYVINDLVKVMQAFAISELQENGNGDLQVLSSLHGLIKQLLLQLPYKRVSPEWGGLITLQVIIADRIDKTADLQAWRESLKPKQKMGLKRMLALNQRYRPLRASSLFKGEEQAGNLKKTQHALMADTWMKDAKGGRAVR
ncbi:MAG: hypothetical protein L3J39_15535 [Verrucomicrobiales bacterium]|nr:hypothetical protein [Verrucomicrobiales bacterium]